MFNCSTSSNSILTKVYSCSVDPQKLYGVHVAINYTPLSIAYYAYDSTAKFLFLGPAALIHVCTVYQKNGTVKRSYMVLEILSN